MRRKVIILFAAAAVSAATACSPAAYIARTARKDLLRQAPLQPAHTGISICDVQTNRYLYNYQAEKYFVPASNTKLFTLYAGLKYLGDSLPGIRYEETADSLFLYPTGDPTLLHPDFSRQPVIEKLQRTAKPIAVISNGWQEEALGAGWTWDDYNDSYMAERSPLPVYGNIIKWIQVSQKNLQPEVGDSMQTFVFSEPEVNWKVRFKEDAGAKTFLVKRKREENLFEVRQGREDSVEQEVPFITNGILSALELMKDTVGKELIPLAVGRNARPQTMYSQPADSLFRPMMYRSDNLFAEQTLLMVSNEKLGIMRDRLIIDTLLKSDLRHLPQQPTWVDGSGLSRYNLFTPQDFVWILRSMVQEFGLERLKGILPRGGNGTLRGYYLQDSAYVFAKTGTLTGQVALSGLMITPKNRVLAFSVLVNNHHGSTTAIRKAVERFLMKVRRKY